MRIKIKKSQISDNGYSPHSPYYRTRVLLPETSQFFGYGIESDVCEEKDGFYVDFPEKCKLIKIEGRVPGTRYARPEITKEEFLKEFGIFSGHLWFGKFANYIFTRDGVCVAAKDEINIGYYDGDKWFTTLDGARHRVAAKTFVLLKLATQEMRLMFETLNKKVIEIQEEKEHLKYIKTMISSNLAFYTENKLDLLKKAATETLSQIDQELLQKKEVADGLQEDYKNLLQ